jgi:hypothetical protein
MSPQLRAKSKVSICAARSAGSGMQVKTGSSNSIDLSYLVPALELDAHT